MACVQFINALVSKPDDLDFRLHLRNEFLRQGLTEVLKVLFFYHFFDSRGGISLRRASSVPILYKRKMKFSYIRNNIKGGMLGTRAGSPHINNPYKTGHLLKKWSMG